MTTKRAKSLLLAMAIGAGTIPKDRSDLQIRHGRGQKDYCDHKARLLSDCLGRRYRCRSSEGAFQSSCSICLSHPYLRFVRHWLYRDDRKRLTRSLVRRLTDEAIAIWYMDTGRLSIKKRHGRPHAADLVMATRCPTREEAQVICDVFGERYGVQMQVKRMQGVFSIRCGTREARHLLSILAPYAMSGMAYKFNLFEKD